MAIIREATPDDVVAIARLNVQVQTLHAEAHPDQFKMPDSAEHGQQLYTDWLAKDENNFFVAEVNGRVVGYVIFRLWVREENDINYERRVLYVDQIAVDDTVRGQGIGRQLMDAAEQAAHEQNADYLFLNVWTFNKQAQAFYDRLGYTTRDIRLWKQL